MRPGEAGRRWVRSLLAACVLACVGAAHADDCSAVQFDAHVGQVSSRWEEFDNGQKRLLRESGPLASVNAGVSTRCLGIEWQLDVLHAHGRRDYSGISSTGGAVQTSSRIAQTEVAMQALAPVDARWRLGARVSHHRIGRELLGTGAVQGYPEQYRYWRAAMGTRHALLQGADWQLFGSAWLGGGPPGRMTLRLPGRDAATLALGPTRHASLALDWYSRRDQPDATGWSWHAGLSHRVEQTDVGPAQVIRRNGVVVGAALQPRTRQFSTGLVAGARYDF